MEVNGNLTKYFKERIMEETKICGICRKAYTEYPNNPNPIKISPAKEGELVKGCCRNCDKTYVTPTRKWMSRYGLRNETVAVVTKDGLVEIYERFGDGELIEILKPEIQEDEIQLVPVSEEDASVKTHTCSICGGTYTGYGFGRWPFRALPSSDEKVNRCCRNCRYTYILPARVWLSQNRMLFKSVKEAIVLYKNGIVEIYDNDEDGKKIAVLKSEVMKSKPFPWWPFSTNPMQLVPVSDDPCDNQQTEPHD